MEATRKRRAEGEEKEGFTEMFPVAAAARGGGGANRRAAKPSISNSRSDAGLETEQREKSTHFRPQNLINPSHGVLR